SPSVASGSATCLDFFRSLGSRVAPAIGGVPRRLCGIFRRYLRVSRNAQAAAGLPASVEAVLADLGHDQIGRRHADEDVERPARAWRVGRAPTTRAHARLPAGLAGGDRASFFEVALRGGSL